MKTKITMRDIINGQKKASVKSFNTDLFKADSENITESFNKENYECLVLVSTDLDTKNEAIKESIIAIDGKDSYILNTNPSNYQGVITTSIYSKWLTLQGFNFFTKDLFMSLDNEFIDGEGQITTTAMDYYNAQIEEAGIEATYDDIMTLGEYNSEYKCQTLSAVIEELDIRVSLTINERGQLSKITKTKLDSKETKQEKPVYKSILD